MIVQTTVQIAVARSIRVAWSGGARAHVTFTEICEEVDRLARCKVALCEALAKFGTRDRLEELVGC